MRDKDIDEEFVALIKQRPQVVLVPNLPDRGVATDLSWLSDSVPADELKKLQDAAHRPAGGADRRSGSRRATWRSSMPRACGSRSAPTAASPGAHHLEMADMVAAGMTPAQVIVAATRNAAEFLRTAPTSARWQTGKSADFLVLDANPLDDITNTRRNRAVYLRGTAVDRAALRQRWAARRSTQ